MVVPPQAELLLLLLLLMVIHYDNISPFPVFVVDANPKTVNRLATNTA